MGIYFLSRPFAILIAWARFAVGGGDRVIMPARTSTLNFFSEALAVFGRAGIPAQPTHSGVPVQPPA